MAGLSPPKSTKLTLIIKRT
ncbi:hypothetical protein CCACVL1_03798 [Corchorus capsularis]|uniref:Uncharacterized protein n=1 Tax=Corchorus capsularis TaxID=210143 RepID=A0A1R3JXC9_COCAP|nr:hypothetical protein CCACVL1_03798 [Corchorus capsularis]